MKKLFLAFVLSLIPSIVLAQSCTSGTWSSTNQEPTTCIPYAGGLFSVELPNAGNGGPLENLYTGGNGSDSIAKATLTQDQTLADSDYGYQTFAATPGARDGGQTALYYGLSTDPIYKITDCYYPPFAPGCATNTSGLPHNVINTYWHIPNKAFYTGLNSGDSMGNPMGDGAFHVWDQTNNKILQLATSANFVKTDPQAKLQNCTATDEAHACLVFTTGQILYGQSANYTDTDVFRVGPVGRQTDTLWELARSVVTRFKEIQSGEIHHAVYLETRCTSDDGPIFPASTDNPLRCSDIGQYSSASRPPEGALVFLDYTDTQLAAMSLPTWKHAFIYAMMHYGGYVGDTLGAETPHSFVIERIEGGEPYELVNGVEDPFFNWLENNQGLHCFGPSGGNQAEYGRCLFSLTWAAGIPNVIGPNCPVTACGIKDHIHIAAECVALGMAGQPGGCTAGGTSTASYNFDQSSGTTVTDQSGSGNTLSLSGTYSFVTGHHGYGLNFDGSTAYGQSTSFPNLSQYTIKVWVKSPNAPTTMNIGCPVSKGRNWTLNWNYTDSTHKGAVFFLQGGSNLPTASFGTLNANTWYRLVVTYDSTNLKAYKNGVLVATTATAAPDPETQLSLTVGRDADLTGSYFFNGVIDDLQIIDSALTANQVLKDYRTHLNFF